MGSKETIHLTIDKDLHQFAKDTRFNMSKALNDTITDAKEDYDNRTRVLSGKPEELDPERYVNVQIKQKYISQASKEFDDSDGIKTNPKGDINQYIDELHGSLEVYEDACRGLENDIKKYKTTIEQQKISIENVRIQLQNNNEDNARILERKNEETRKTKQDLDKTIHKIEQMDKHIEDLERIIKDLDDKILQTEQDTEQRKDITPIISQAKAVLVLSLSKNTLAPEHAHISPIFDYQKGNLQCARCHEYYNSLTIYKKISLCDECCKAIRPRSLLSMFSKDK